MGVYGVTLRAGGIEREVAGIGEDLGRGEHSVAREVHNSEQAERAARGEQGWAGIGDGDRELGRLASGTDGANRTDDWTILVTAANG